MKTLLILVAAFTISSAAFAQDTVSHKTHKMTDKMEGHTKKMDKMNCVMMKDGQMMMTKAGKTTKMDKDMKMKNGTMVKKDGTMKMKDGKSMKMKEGDMMDMDGMMGKMEDMDDMKE